MKVRNIIRALMFVGSFLPTMSLPAGAHAAGTAVVTLACQPATVSEGKQFSVFVNITPNNAIAGAQFTLNFNPSILTANGVTEGNMLKQGGASTYFLPGQIDNQNGKVTGVAVAITGPGQTVSGAGTLAVIAMTAKYTSGTSPLNLTSVIVGDMSGKAVPANVAAGQVAVAGTAAPTPTAGAATGQIVSVGGGVGGGYPPSGPSITNLTMFTNGDGLFVLSGQASSEDGRAQLQIGTGTQANTKDGAALKWLSINETTGTRAYSVEQILVSAVYDFGPEGAVFSSPVTLSLSYDPSLVPTGFADRSICIAFWDQATGRWIERASTVDSERHVLKAAVMNLSRYAVIAQARPADLSISSVTTSPERATVGEPVTISVTVSNGGDIEGTYDVTPSVSPGNGPTFGMQAVQVPGGTSREVAFTVIEDSPGLFAVTVGGVRGVFLVEAKSAPTSAPRPTPKLSTFIVVPEYTPDAMISSAALNYEVINLGIDSAEARMVAKVDFNGQWFCEVVLLSEEVAAGKSSSGRLEYLPSSGWTNGTYTFHAELYSGSSLVGETEAQTVYVNNRKTTTVSWYVLSIIIGSTLLASFILTMLVLRRRKELLEAWTRDS